MVSLLAVETMVKISSSFACVALASRSCAFWIRNTIRNVMTVVDVFTTSCQVSEKSKKGPLMPHNRMNKVASPNAR